MKTKIVNFRNAILAHTLVGLTLFVSTISLAGNTDGGGGGIHIGLIMNCESVSSDNSIYQLLIGPPQLPNGLVSLDAGNTSVFPVRMNQYKGESCHGIEGFDSAQIKTKISDTINITFESLTREQEIPAFNAKGWRLIFNAEERAKKGRNKGKFKAKLDFILVQGSMIPVEFYCSTSESSSEDLQRKCEK